MSLEAQFHQSIGGFHSPFGCGGFQGQPGDTNPFSTFRGCQGVDERMSLTLSPTMEGEEYVGLPTEEVRLGVKVIIPNEGTSKKELANEIIKWGYPVYGLGQFLLTFEDSPLPENQSLTTKNFIVQVSPGIESWQGWDRESLKKRHPTITIKPKPPEGFISHPPQSLKLSLLALTETLNENYGELIDHFINANF
jgi:hypothetical protein